MPEETSLQLQRKGSVIQAFDKGGNLYKGFHIWTDKAPAVKSNPDILFAECLLLAGSSETNYKCRQLSPEEGAEFEIKPQFAYNCNMNVDPLGYNDIGGLPHTNIPCVLDFLQQRFSKTLIYTNADPLLVAMNPFKDLGLTTDEKIRQYRDAGDPATLPPHVFTIARTALENLHGVNKSQTIIVCGESGAGKTEATKHVMRYFAANKGGAGDSRIQNAVLAANPVLEAFGNAKTLRNDNSSRFGRFMQLQVATGGGIEYGSVRNFLLEKSRILSQADGERSYHIFYQLSKAPDSLKSELSYQDITSYKFINPSCTSIPTMDDAKEFKEVDEALLKMGIEETEKKHIYSLLSGILLLGNVTLKAVEKEGLSDAAEIDEKSRPTFNKACELLFLPSAGVEEGIVVKTTTAGKSVVKGCWRKDEAEILMHSLSKAIYEKLFDYLVKRLNTNIEPAGGFKFFMGMLDIFGFEVFKNNSLEQLFINITNEMLQKNFIDVVFERETKLYREEGISAAELEWTTNKPIIELLVNKKGSLMAVLEDQCLAPGGNDEKLVSALSTTLKDNKHYVKAKINANINFIIAHTIGEIQYNATNFLTKNKDVLRAELVDVVQQSENAVTKKLFEGVVMEKGKLAKGQLIGSQFMASLEKLVALINSTEPHFIRCVKPNEEKAALKFVNSKVLVQLHALSILEALQLRNLGYSYRRPFEDFIFQFKFCDVGASESKTLAPRDICAEIFKSSKIEKGFQVGKTMVFMKQETMKALVNRQREALATWEPIVSILEAARIRKKRMKEIEQLLPSLIRFQAHCRKALHIWDVSGGVGVSDVK